MQRRELEGTIKRYLGRDPDEQPPGLRPGQLAAGMAAGLGQRKRLKRWQDLLGKDASYMAAFGAQLRSDDAYESTDTSEHSKTVSYIQDYHSTLAAGVHSTDTGARLADQSSSESQGQAPDPRVISEMRLKNAHDGGQLWHGQQLVAAALHRGGDAELHKLICRFRTAFIEACKPKFLPMKWEVAHAAKRQFGSYSVYRAEASADSGAANE